MRERKLGQPKPTYYGWGVGQPAPQHYWQYGTPPPPQHYGWDVGQLGQEPGLSPTQWPYTLGYDPRYGWGTGAVARHPSQHVAPRATTFGAIGQAEEAPDAPPEMPLPRKATPWYVWAGLGLGVVGVGYAVMRSSRAA